MKQSSKRRNAFTLVELVMVVTIIGTITSIAVPRVSGSVRSSRVHAMQETLVNVRTAIDVYYAEHGRFPGYDPASGLPNDQKFVDQLLNFTDERGVTSATPSSTFRYGPYLRSPFPVNPQNDLATVKVKATPLSADPAAGSAGWVAVLSHGYFGILASDIELDDFGAVTPNFKALFRGLSNDTQ